MSAGLIYRDQIVLLGENVKAIGRSDNTLIIEYFSPHGSKVLIYENEDLAQHAMAELSDGLDLIDVTPESLKMLEESDYVA